MSKAQLRTIWEDLRASYWFLPLCLSLLAVVLATLLFLVDEWIPNRTLTRALLVAHLEPESVRTTLLGIASGAVGIVGVVFSVTLVPLTIASSQFGPVLLRNYLRDLGTQLVMGMYCATVCYALWLVLLLPVSLSAETVPQLAITFGIAMLLVCLALLIYLFHHTAVSLQASTVVERIGEELLAVVREAFPPKGEGRGLTWTASASLGHTELAEHQGQVLHASSTGYVRAVDLERLVRLAEDHDLILAVHAAPGAFVATGGVLALAWPAEQAGAELEDAANDAFLLGPYRTPVQDVEFGMMSLVVVASRALSAAINDPVTPILCLDRLGVALGLVAAGEQPSAYHHDHDGRLRVVLQPQNFTSLAGVAFDRIRQYGRTDAPLLIHLLTTIAAVGAHTTAEAQRAVLGRHAQKVVETADVFCEADREQVAQAYARTLRALGLGGDRPDLSTQQREVGVATAASAPENL